MSFLAYASNQNNHNIKICREMTVSIRIKKQLELIANLVIQYFQINQRYKLLFLLSHLTKTTINQGSR